MRALMVATSNVFNGFIRETSIRHRSQNSIFVALLAASILAIAGTNSVSAQMTTENPQIEGFVCYVSELDPGSSVHQFTFVGLLTGCDFPGGRTIKMAGGPFTTSTTTDQDGSFTVTFTMDYADGIGQMVSCALYEGGQVLSEPVTIVVE